MYIISKHFDFTEDELEVIYKFLVSDYENLVVWISEHGVPSEDEEFNAKLYFLEFIIEKISDNGIFSDDISKPCRDSKGGGCNV